MSTKLIPFPRPRMGQVFRRSHEPGKWQFARVTGFHDLGTALRRVPGQAEPEKVEMWSAVISDGFQITEHVTHITMCGLGFWEPVEDELQAHVTALEQDYEVAQRNKVEMVETIDALQSRVAQLESALRFNQDTIGNLVARLAALEKAEAPVVEPSPAPTLPVRSARAERAARAGAPAAG